GRRDPAFRGSAQSNQTRRRLVKIIRVFGPTATAVCLALASASVPLLAPAPAVAQAAQDDQIPTTNGNLTIHPVHHAGVVLTWNGKRIVADPTAWPPGDKSGAAEFRGAAPPDVILITHEHADHFSVATLNELVGPNTIIVAPQSV